MRKPTYSNSELIICGLLAFGITVAIGFTFELLMGLI